MDHKNAPVPRIQGAPLDLGDAGNSKRLVLAVADRPRHLKHAHDPTVSKAQKTAVHAVDRSQSQSRKIQQAWLLALEHM